MPILNDEQRRALAKTVEAGPILASRDVVRCRLIDLAQWIWDEFGLSITQQTMSREMRSLGFRNRSARPRQHGQKEDAVGDFKKLRRPTGDDNGDAAARHAHRAVVAG